MVVLHGSTSNKEVALLFDDGPNSNITPRLLDELNSRDIVANFFLIGMRAEQSPEIVKRIVNEGHEIGNHTYTHKRLTQLLEERGFQAVIDEVNKGKQAIEAAGVSADRIKYFRPPYLDWNNDLAKLIEPLYGDNIIMSGLAVGDWDWGVNHVWDSSDTSAIQKQAQRITREWKQRTINGTLLGFHDSSEHNLPGNKQFDTWMNRALPTLEALPQIIDNILSEGYKIKRLSDMQLIKQPYQDKRN